jgi:hypothetical protein
MTFCPAAITTAALFTAIVIIDLAKGKYRSVPFHALGGFFCTLGLSFICQTLGDTAGWIILSIPFIFILLGLFMIWLSGPTTVAEASEDSCRETRPTCAQNPYPVKIACTPTAPPPRLPASVTSVPPATSISTLGCSKPPTPPISTLACSKPPKLSCS